MPVEPDRTPEFGDNVRIRRTPETEAAGYADLVGQVYGFTQPSILDEKVFGELTDDFALNVFFEERHENAWFAPELLEFVDHGAGMELSVGENPARKFVRNAAGGWDVVDLRPAPAGWLQRLRRLFG